jgi:hypothetical protein
MMPPRRLLSDCDGHIATVLACLPAPVVDEEPTLAAALLAAPPGRLLVVTHERAVPAVSGLAAGRTVDLVVCPDETPLTVWTQDALVAFDHPAGPLIGRSRRVGPHSPPSPCSSTWRRRACRS